MSDSGFYLLPTNKLYKKEDSRQIKNFLAGTLEVFTEILRTMLIILLAQISIPE